MAPESKQQWCLGLAAGGEAGSRGMGRRAGRFGLMPGHGTLRKESGERVTLLGWEDSGQRGGGAPVQFAPYLHQNLTVYNTPHSLPVPPRVDPYRRPQLSALAFWARSSPTNGTLSAAQGGGRREGQWYFFPAATHHPLQAPSIPGHSPAKADPRGNLSHPQDPFSGLQAPFPQSALGFCRS